ncbi:hypothetical protein WJX74_003405 [Apatococcus lobatus]|uniref:Exoribonuclease phosphorolytic domain-containing protein n=1 Tax=Apatococcus lobatus TaxID=904363 RepID=A0AAW1S4Z7_9CHLO
MTRDGERSPRQLRNLVCERSLLHRADGSAKFFLGKTCVLACVYGPTSTVTRKENAEQAVIEVNYRPMAGIAGTQERQQEHLIRRTIEGVVLVALHPRACISVIIQVLEDNGSALACAVNAACTALVDAAVPMHRLFASVCCCTTQDGELLVDPSSTEEQEAAAVLTLVYTSRRAEVEAARPSISSAPMMSFSSGQCTPQQYLLAALAGREACQRLADFSYLSLHKSFS